MSERICAISLTCSCEHIQCKPFRRAAIPRPVARCNVSGYDHSLFWGEQTPSLNCPHKALGRRRSPRHNSLVLSTDIVPTIEPVAKFTLDTPNAEAWRSLELAGKATPTLGDCKSITLGGALELFATATALGNSSRLSGEINRAASSGHPVWHGIITEWRPRRIASHKADLFGVRSIEFFRIHRAADITSDHFSLLLQRFCRSMRKAGFPKKFAEALSKVLGEMADNVVQHSEERADAFTGMGGYHVGDRAAAFTVTDVGRGVLASLNASPDWQHLKTSRQALRAIVEQRASSRARQGEGEGFKQLFKALVDRSGSIRLRSGNAVVTISDGVNGREAREGGSPSLAGLQVCVCCAVGGPAKEIKIGG